MNDKLTNSQKKETIRAIADCNLNKKATSRMLFLSRNALTYRIEQIKKETGLDARVFRDLVELLRLLKEEQLYTHTEIKPCPFCGKSAASISTAKEMEECENFERCIDCDYVTVVCDFNKGGCGASSGYRCTEEDAILAWNERAKK